MKIAVGSDHAGYEEPPPYCKPEITKYLETLGHDIIDCGTHGPQSVDYPDFADQVCASVLNGAADMGVLICGTGIGMGIAANRHKGIRAAVCVTPEMARISRDHNNANVLAVGRRLLSLSEMKAIVSIFLSTPFSGGERHERRIEKMDC